MTSPTVSVIIPSYNYADYIAGCIQSVLDQTFTDFELIVVDDGSQDHTADVVRQFTDPRVRYVYQKNKGLPGARNTGIHASSGRYLAFLDSDDKFHPRKLAIQVAFLQEHDDVGLVYNSRFLVDSAGQCLKLRRAPASVKIADLVLGYPFAPSDVVMRRVWADRVGLFDESFVLNSEDLNFHLRLALAGCQFAGVPQALAYRQLHTGRHFRQIASKLDTYIRALNTAFLDPRCPPMVLALRDLAFADHYLTWGYQAAVQGETSLAQRSFQQMLALDPTLLDDDGARLLNFFAHASTRDGGDHEANLQALFAGLPSELARLEPAKTAVISRGYLIRGVRDIFWGREEIGRRHLARAAAMGARLDDPFLYGLNDQLLNYEAEFGEVEAGAVLRRLLPYLHKLGSRSRLRQLSGNFAVNRVFKNYLAGNYGEVWRNAVQAVTSDPWQLANRGVWSITLRSLWKSARRGVPDGV